MIPVREDDEFGREIERITREAELEAGRCEPGGFALDIDDEETEANE